MRFNVLYLARLRDAFGRRGEEIDLPSVDTVEKLIDALRNRGGPWASELAAGRAVRVAVNQQVSPMSTPLHEGDEVALLPPVTGG